MSKGVYYVVELLQSFDNKELKALQSIAACSYFNTEKNVINLLDILIEKVNRIESISQKDLVSIYNTLYNTKLKVLNNKQLNTVHSKMSLLYSLIQQYLMQEALKKDEQAKAGLLQQQLLEKRKYRHYKKFLKRQRNLLKQSLIKDVDFYQHQYTIESEALGFAQISRDVKQQYSTGLVKDSFTLYFLLNQLDLYLIELYLQETSAFYKADKTYYEALKPLIKLPAYSQNALVKVYQSVIHLMENKTDTAYSNLINDLDNYRTNIPTDSQINFYNSLLNFCVLQVRKGRIEYKKHQLDLYKIMDEKNLLLTDNQIHIGNLRNIVSLGCQLEEFNWVTKILKKYYDFLPTNLKKEIVDFNIGIISFFQKDYQKAINYLFPLPTINLSHDINRRIFIMEAYYELDADYKETTHTLFRAFEKYIREHKSLTGKSKTSYKNFIRTLINLYRIKHKVTKMRLSNLKEKLVAQKLNSNKSWLLEKITELENTN